MTGPEHYEIAENLVMTAAGVMDFDHGLYASMGTDERLKRRAALTAEAQVHATLALAAATALQIGNPFPGANPNRDRWATVSEPVVLGFNTDRPD